MKKISITCIALALLTGGAATHAQDYGKQLGGPVKIGNMTMAAYGDNPGIGFNFMSCKRQDGKVLLSFQYPSQVNRDIENIWIRNYEPNATEVFGPDGTKYTISYIKLGDKSSSEGVGVDIPQGQALNGQLVIEGVPADVKTLGKVVFRSSGQYPMDAITHSYTFTLDNVTITEPVVVQPAPQPAASTATAAKSSKDSGSRSALVDGKVQPGKSSGIFQPGASAVAKPAEGWLITPEGVGPIKLNTNIKAMPGRVEGLFNKVKMWDANNGTLYLDGNECINLSLTNDKITGISVYGNVAKVKVGNKTYGIGDDIDELKTQPGVTGPSYNDTADYNGIHFDGHDSEIQTITVGKQN